MQKNYSDSNIPLIERHICALASYGHGDCRGDSGGPFVCGGKLTGTVSFGSDDCAVGIPDVYAGVPFYINFINQACKS